MKKPTEKQKIVLRELVDNRCQICDRAENQCGELVMHRIRRGSAGGKYTGNNILVICTSCHFKLHHQERFK